MDKINWIYLSINPNAIDILEKNQDKIDWNNLSLNSSAIAILEKNLDKINYNFFSQNSNAISLLEKNVEYINWEALSFNTSIFELDYSSMKERYSIYKEELIQVALHPSRIQKYLEQGINFEDLENYI